MPANETQVGGTHYKVGELPEHWDLVCMYNWDYFQGQITKYLMRWKTKYENPVKKLEDLRKARHFLDKYIEEYPRFLPLAPTYDNIGMNLASYEKDSAVYISDANFLCEGGWGNGQNLYTCRKCKKKFIASSLESSNLHDHYDVEHLHF